MRLLFYAGSLSVCRREAHPAERRAKTPGTTAPAPATMESPPFEPTRRSGGRGHRSGGRRYGAGGRRHCCEGRRHATGGREHSSGGRRHRPGGMRHLSGSRRHLSGSRRHRPGDWKRGPGAGPMPRSTLCGIRHRPPGSQEAFCGPRDRTPGSRSFAAIPGWDPRFPGIHCSPETESSLPEEEPLVPKTSVAAPGTDPRHSNGARRPCIPNPGRITCIHTVGLGCIRLLDAICLRGKS